MRFIATLKILGILLMIFSLSMLTPIIVANIYHDGAIRPFLVSFFITLGTGFVLWFIFCRFHAELKTRDGFLVVVLFWVVLSAFGAIPFMLDPVHKLSLVDAVFESISGLTTTGATVLSHIDQLPHAILYYRQQLHFLGGMGIIVLAVAILPMLGVGGNLLARAETTGPNKNNKLKPRMAETAKSLWTIYVGLVVLCAIFFWLSGLHMFNAICESFSVVSTGGFALHDSSFAYYQNTMIQVVGVVFMLLGATNFGLHFQMMQEKSLKVYFRDPEFKAYIIFLAVIVAITTGTLYIYDHFQHLGSDFFDALFNIISVSTTTGLTVSNFANWPTYLPYLLMFVALIGGCSASTAGGIKVVRVLLMKAQCRREIKRLIHPQAVVKAKLGSEHLPDSVIQGIWGFMSVFIAVYVVLMVVLLADGLSLKVVFSDLSACISNTGVGIAGDFEHLTSFSKWVLSVAMILGRLEIFTVLVLFSPSFWRR